MRLRRQLALRLVCAAAFVVALVAAPGALAQGAPATTFSAAGSAMDINGVSGPCAVAVAGVSSAAGVAGSGTFTAAEGQEGSGSGRSAAAPRRRSTTTSSRRAAPAAR